MTSGSKAVKKHRQRDIEYARHDPATALASLFRPITRGRRPGGLEVRTQFDGIELRFMIWKALDTRDQSVLLALIGMAGKDADNLGAQTQGDRGQQLWIDLEPSEQAQFDRAVVVTTSRYKLIKEAGLDDKGQNYGLLEECLTRLSMVGCRAHSNGYQWSMNMLSWSEAPDGRINIALNGRFASALEGQHVRVSLHERHQLHGEASKIAHNFLSAWTKPGRSNKTSLDKLACRVWGSEAASSSTQASRRNRITKALDEIAELPGWKIEISGRGKNSMALIRRPAVIKSTD